MNKETTEDASDWAISEDSDQSPWLQNHDENETVDLNDGMTEIIKQEGKEDQTTSCSVNKNQISRRDDIRQDAAEHGEFLYITEKSIDVVATAAIAMVSGEDDDESSNTSLISTDVASVSQNNTSDDTVMSEVVTMKMNIGNHDNSCWPEDIGVHKMSNSEIIGVQGDSVPVKSKRKRKRPASEIYECSICGEKLQSKISLEKHQITHSGEAAFVCGICGKAFVRSESLTLHLKLHADEDGNICPCEICGQEFINAQLLQQHQCMHAGGQQYKCQTCGSSFEVESDLQAHILSAHDEVKAFTCDICGKSFKKKQYLKKHCTTHEEDRGYKCDICGAKIMGSHQYKNHMTVHKGERPHACTVCDKKFTLPVYLKRHMLIHSGERPYKCEVCDKTFVASNYLITHRKTVHAGIRNFACDYCDKRFYHSGALRNHIRMHTGERPFECNVCKRRFQSSDQVKAHMRKHTGEKPYSCDVCGQKFQRKFSLDDHRRIHFGIKPFKCFICEESFFRQSGLYSHMKSCHEEDRLRCPECDMFCTTHQSLMRHLYVQHNVMQYAEEVKPGKRFNSTAAQEMMLLYKKQVLLGPGGKDMMLSMGLNGTEQNVELVQKSPDFSDMVTGDSNDGFSVDSPSSSSKEDENKCLDSDEKLTSNKADLGDGSVREEVVGECIE